MVDHLVHDTINFHSFAHGVSRNGTQFPGLEVSLKWNLNLNQIFTWIIKGLIIYIYILKIIPYLNLHCVSLCRTSIIKTFSRFTADINMTMLTKEFKFGLICSEHLPSVIYSPVLMNHVQNFSKKQVNNCNVWFLVYCLYFYCLYSLGVMVALVLVICFAHSNTLRD